jgi:Zn-dependent protease
MVILNHLPIPPLDGYGIIESWLDEKLQYYMRKLSMGTFILLYFLMGFVPAFHDALMSGALAIMKFLGSVPFSSVPCPFWGKWICP